MIPNFPSFLFLPKELIIRTSKGKSGSIFSHELKQLDLMAGKPEHLIDFGSPIYREARQLEKVAELGGAVKGPIASARIIGR